MSSTGAAIAEQFSRTWSMLREAVSLYPPERWTTSEPSFEPTLAPARQALHAVETVEYYLSDDPDGFSWGARFGVDWESGDVDRLPSQQDILVYADEVGGTLQLRVRRMTVGAASVFPWTGGSVAEHWLYVLRHTQHHVAVMNAMLTMKGQPTANWK